MSNTQRMPPWMFNLEGTFLGFFGKDSEKPKSVLVEVEQEEVPIKLPKELRASLRQRLKVGDRICCIGRSQIDSATGVIKLQAYTLFSLPSYAESAPTPHLYPQSGCPPKSSEPKCAKILLCKKSGCQKRGGRQLIVTLEQVLKEYQLQDQVEIQYSGCQKRCSKAPSLTIMPGEHRYERLTPTGISAIIEEHFCTP